MADLRGLKVMIRGAGEMASAVAHRLHRAHFRVLCTERPEPLAVRRLVSFSEAVFEGRWIVEGVQAELIPDAAQAEAVWNTGRLPVLVDPGMGCLDVLKPAVLVEATLAKINDFGLRSTWAPLVIALGPGFEAPREAHFVVETNRGHDLGRIIEAGAAAPDTGRPGRVGGYTWERVFRAPASGLFRSERSIGDRVQAGEVVGRVDDEPVRAQVGGLLRGLIRPGLVVSAGTKLGDVDPRPDPSSPGLISDKARNISGAVLECLLRKFNI